MLDNVDLTRRWLINTGGAVILSNVVAIDATHAQTPAMATPGVRGDPVANLTPDAASISPTTTVLADYVAGTLDRALPATAVARTKLHVLDTIAAMVSGSRLKAGKFAARYVDNLGGRPQATVVGASLLTSVVNAAFANAMAAHADETDDTHPAGPFHAGCGAVSAGLAMAELAGRTGDDMLRAVAIGYDIGARLIMSLGEPRQPGYLANTLVATAVSAALLRLNARQVRYALSYAAQQASGIGTWVRDRDHIEKAFDFGGMGARNGVMAATMVEQGFTGVEDVFGGRDNAFSALGEKPLPDRLAAELGTRFEVFNTTIKKWSVGSPLQPVLDSMAVILDDPSVRAGQIKHITVEVPTESLRIVDNATIPDLCLQHLVALMIVDGGATFASIHDEARMGDPNILAIRKLVDVMPSEELQAALPTRQAIVTIDTADGRTLRNRTDIVRGTVRNPMEKHEVEAKALDLMAPVLGTGRANDLIQALGHLDSFGPVSGLRPLLQA